MNLVFVFMLFNCILQTVCESVTWVNVNSAILSKEDPHGYSSSFNVDLHIGRIAQDEGYILGYVPSEGNKKGFFGRKQDGSVMQLQNLDDVEILTYPPDTTSWYLVDSEDQIEKVRPLMVTAGKGTAGVEDLYVCRALLNHEGYSGLFVGHYMQSKGPVCSTAVFEFAGKKSKVFEILILNMSGESSGDIAR